MCKANKIVFSFRLNERQYEKVRCIAEQAHYSINRQLEVFVDSCIEQYEDKNGEINVDALFDD